MNVRRMTRLLAFLVVCSWMNPSMAFDPLQTVGSVPVTAASSFVSDAADCVFGVPQEPLRLEEAVQRALCSNPKTREAWADVKAQAAGLGEARGAYLPTLSGSAQVVRDDSIQNVINHPTLSSASVSNVNSESVSLNWTLFDFGARAAAVRNANALLEAARATQDADLQSLFVAVAKDYYAAQAAAGALAAARDVERMAQESAAAARARTDRGIAPISDELQAQTASAQATLERVKAEGAWQSAVGTLATDMDLRPDVPLQLPSVEQGVRPDTGFTTSIGELMDDAIRSHPTVLAAEAQRDAAEAKIQQTRDESLPSLSLVSKYSRDNQPASLGLGLPQFPATGHDWYVGVQLSIPLFEGFQRVYQVRQAEAQFEKQDITVEDAQQQVALEVWNSYQAVQTSTQSASDSERLLSIAQRSFAAASHRYQVGVGNILELLNAQSALANAQQQRIKTLSDWRAARLRMAGSLGRLDATDLQ